MRLLLLFLLLATLPTHARPAIDKNFPDPMAFKASDGYYYAYATGGRDRHVSVSRSADLSHWEEVREAMPKRPRWTGRNKVFWAPHVIEHEGLFYLYFSAQPAWSRHEKMRLGVAVSRSPAGPFVPDLEPLDTGDAEENIDPMVFIDRGRAYLYWGRNGVINAQELAPSLRAFAERSEPRELLHPGSGRYDKVVEGPYVMKHGNQYYLFYSGDDCCVKPHYAVSVARAPTALGPFEKLGVILKRDSRWLAPGHNGIIEDHAGQLWMIYHAVDARRPRLSDGSTIRRVMKLDRLELGDGWPRIRKK